MKLRSVIFWLLVGVLVVVALLHVGEIEKVLQLLRSLRWQWLVAAAAAQIFTYVTTAWALQGILNTLDYELSWRQLWRSAVAFVLMSQTVPTAGVGGLMIWSMGLSQLGVPREGAFASGIFYSMLDYVAFFMLLAAAVLVLLLQHSLPRALLVPLVLMSIAILTGAAAAARLMSRQERGLAVLSRMVMLFNRMPVWLRRISLDLKGIRETAGRFYADWRTMRSRRRRLVLPTFWVLAARLLDVLTLQLLFAATGHPMAWGAIAIGFVYASFASAASVLPTGLGFLDASLALLYAGLGAPLSVAVTVTLLFRILAYWLPIPYGLYAYRRITHTHATGTIPLSAATDGT